MKNIILTVGAPACGKSTWAIKQVKESNGKIKRINKDDLRMMIDSDTFSLSSERMILDIRDFAVERFLGKGYDVIIDDTNLHPKHFKRMCELAARVGDTVVTEKHFDIVPVEELIRRNAARDRSVPEDVIRRMHEQWEKTKRSTPFYSPSKITQDRLNLVHWNDDDSPVRDRPQAVIFDIDGTLALHHRNPYDMSLLHTDEPNRPVIYTLNLYHNMGVRIIIVSGRSDKFRVETEAWLDKHKIHFDEIHMRPTDQPDVKDSIIKENIYYGYLAHRYFILGVFDDRNQVVDKWRQLGLPVFQVNWGNF